MKILVTGSNGFVGRNLIWNLMALRDGKDRTRPSLTITQIYGYDIDTGEELLEEACEHADFVFHLAGVNRPKETADFMEGNFGFSSVLLEKLKAHGNRCPVMLASSIQASLAGRFADSPYGQSKRAGEELFFGYAEETGAEVLVYRFPNVFGKWCRPNYNSAVATFCHAVANGRDYTVHDRQTELELVYIDDLVEALLDAMEGRRQRCDYPAEGAYDGLTPVPSESGRYCYVPVTHRETLGHIVDLLEEFARMPETLVMPEIPAGSFAKKLLSTYLSYLPPEKMSYPLHSHVDSRGSFTELVRTAGCGQVSVNVARPGSTRGQHWHNSKWEIFMVVSGHGLIRERRLGIDPETGREWPVVEFEVTGAQLRAVQMLPGYTHEITNLSETEDLVTVMWANERFDERRPDTFYEAVVAIQSRDLRSPQVACESAEVAPRA